MRLTKHHGLGNDFLVLLDLDDRIDVDEATARALCDRRRGVGADGVIRVGSGRDGADVTMALRNADGSSAEISGNGARCLGHAVAMQRGLDLLDLSVATDAGIRRVRVEPGDAPNTVWSSVEMGTAKVVTLEADAPPRMAEVDLGNPHLVLLYDDGDVPDGVLERRGRERPDLNTEVVGLGPGPDVLTMRVWERGVGETLACGTGACAAAVAARDWGLVGERVTVRMPGGDADVTLGGGIVLSGPSVYVATIEVPWH